MTNNYISMNFELNEEQKLIKEAASDFANQVLLSYHS
jgi:hypothetical protein